MPGVDDRRHGGFAWREVPSASTAAAVLFLHGLGGTSWSWDAQLGAWPDERRLLAWDLPGYGESAALDVPPTFGRWAHGVFQWADEAGVDRFHLVGISMGGMIAQYAAALDMASATPRIASLALLATSPKFGLDGTRPDEWLARRLAPLAAGQRPADFAESVLSTLAGPRCPADALAGQVAAMRRIGAGALRSSLGCLVTHDSRPVLAKIAAPTLILVGSEDAETPPAYAHALAEGIAAAVVEIVPGAGHLLNAEAPDAVTARLARHVAEHEAVVRR